MVLPAIVNSWRQEIPAFHNATNHLHTSRNLALSNKLRVFHLQSVWLALFTSKCQLWNKVFPLMLVKRWFKALFRGKNLKITDWNLCSSVRDIELVEIKFKRRHSEKLSSISLQEPVLPSITSNTGCTSAVIAESLGKWIWARGSLVFRQDNSREVWQHWSQLQACTWRRKFTLKLH